MSTLPSIAASVSTLVVSWKEAADRNESVANDALVMPRDERARRGHVASLEHDAVDLFLELVAIDLGARQEPGAARIGDRHLAQHLARDDLDVLVVDVDALGRVDVLDLVDDVAQRRVDVGEAQELMRIDGALGQLLADLDGAHVGNARHELCACARLVPRAPRRPRCGW